MARAGIRVALICSPAALVALASCSSAPQVEKVGKVAHPDGLPAGELMESLNLTARVSHLDVTNRKATLVAPDGSRNTFVAGPEDRVFDKLQVGNRVQARVTRELLVLFGKNQAALSHGPILPPVLTSTDDKGGVMRSEILQQTASIGTVDRKRRLATLEFAPGVSRTFPIREDVDPRWLKPGTEVVVRTSAFVVLTVKEQPKATSPEEGASPKP